MKVKWKVQEAPTGRYRSFERRGWPEAFYPDGQLAAMVQCDDDYVPSCARVGSHQPLTALVYSYSEGSQRRRMYRLVERFDRLEQVKTAVERCLAGNPGFWPKKEEA